MPIDTWPLGKIIGPGKTTPHRSTQEALPSQLLLFLSCPCAGGAYSEISSTDGLCAW